MAFEIQNSQQSQKNRRRDAFLTPSVYRLQQQQQQQLGQQQLDQEPLNECSNGHDSGGSGEPIAGPRTSSSSSNSSSPIIRYEDIPLFDTCSISELQHEMMDGIVDRVGMGVLHERSSSLLSSTSSLSSSISDTTTNSTTRQEQGVLFSSLMSTTNTNNDSNELVDRILREVPETMQSVSERVSSYSVLSFGAYSHLLSVFYYYYYYYYLFIYYCLLIN